MAGAIEELFSYLKIVPDDNNLRNISEHLDGFDALIATFTKNLAELSIKHFADDTGNASENLKKAGAFVNALKQSMPSIEKNMGSTEASAGGFKKEIKGANENLDDAAKKSQLMTNYLHSLSIIGGTIKSVVQGWVNEMKNFASESLRAGNEFQKMKLSMQGIFNDDKMGEDFIKQLTNMEKASAFTAEQLAGVANQLIPSFDKPELVMSMLNDIQRMALGDQSKLNGVANAFIQIGNSAQISQRELKMFRTASGGLNIAKQLETDLGKSKKEIDKMLKDGLISKNHISDAIRNISAELGDKPEKIGDMFDSVFGRVRNAIQRNLGSALLPLANALKPLAEQLENIDFENTAKRIEPFAAALVAASPMIFNVAKAFMSLAEILMAVSAPFAQLLGWVLNFIAKTPGLNALFLGLIGLLGMKGLTFVLQMLIAKVRDMAQHFLILASNAGTAGTAVETAGIHIANTGRKAQNASVEIANAGRATRALSVQAASSPIALTRMVGGLRKVALGVRALGRTVKATLVGIGPAGWAMLGIGAAAEIYSYFQNKKEENHMKDFDMTLPKDQKLPKWEFDMTNNIDNHFQLDSKGKSNMSKEMLETAIREQTRSIFNMEIMRILEISEQGGAVST
jgi:hypothetical protein